MLVRDDVVDLLLVPIARVGERNPDESRPPAARYISGVGPGGVARGLRRRPTSSLPRLKRLQVLARGADDLLDIKKGKS
jgi:hypothetical protein